MADHVERFAPSPTGPLHLGHAFSAITAYNRAKAANGTFLLRIEDIDITRARPEWEAQIYDDLAWLGLDWPTPVLRQSDRFQIYQYHLRTLWDRGLLFACTCNRRDVKAAAAAPQEGPLPIGPDGIVYPGTCRNKRRSTDFPDAQVYRLDMRRAVETVDWPLKYFETGSEPDPTWIETTADDLIQNVGDVVLGRHGTGASYHLAVTIDDAFQKVTHVTRGEDVQDATQIHVLLQHLFGLPAPTYHHHRLIRDENGKRLAKRDDARAIRKYREDGATPEDIRRMVGL